MFIVYLMIGVIALGVLFIPCLIRDPDFLDRQRLFMYVIEYIVIILLWPLFVISNIITYVYLILKGRD